MITAIKRSMSVVLAFVLVFAVVFGVNIQANAATVEYVKSGKYIYNWGTREETATFLSPNAEKFYKDNNTTFEKLASLSGSSSVSSVPSSALYKELQNLMKKNHSYIISYQSTRPLYQYTDCQNSGKTSKKISSFYSGVEIGPAWDSGETWNREHVWPNSKGNQAGEGENDIMMLRPTAKSENGSRGNKAYGKSSSYYNPNMESGGNHDLRGDVSRILLYQYVRWGCTNTMWGSSGVIENREVLLEWVKADPVDTWELGRNDSVEAITGTRNVFVDYPELAFVLFGQQVPSDYTTPSGNAKNGVTTQPVPDNNNQNNTHGDTQNNTQNNAQSNTQNNVQSNSQSTTPSVTACKHANAYNVEPEDPRCELEGYTVGKYCPDCKKYISGHKLIEATGHTYAGDCATECDTCGDVRQITDDVKHTYGDDNICTICGTVNADNTVDENVQTIGPSEPQNNSIVWWLVGGGVFVIATGVVLLIVFRKKIWPDNIE